MKKKLLALCMLVALVFSAVGGSVAFAAVSLEDCDLCFQTTVNGFLGNDDVEGNSVTAVRNPVYDINLQHLGYVYEFEIIGGNGYAIIICDDGNYIAQEFVPCGENPYSTLSEGDKPVYVNSSIYLKHDGNAYYDIKTLQEIPDEVITALSEDAILYSETYPSNKQTETVKVSYQSKSYDNNGLALRTPHYLSPGGIENACAAVAGGNLIGYFDRFYEDLIPNHAAGTFIYGYFVYNYADDYVDKAIKDLYADMKGTSAGISEANFKGGMQKYCSDRNLTCDFTQLVSGGKLSFSAVKQCIDGNNPIALFLSTYTICEILGSDGYDTQYYDIYSGNHVMAGFGYSGITYKMTDGSSKTYEFIYVASGFDMPVDAYFNINYKTNINSAYKVNVH